MVTMIKCASCDTVEFNLLLVTRGKNRERTFRKHLGKWVENG